MHFSLATFVVALAVLIVATQPPVKGNQIAIPVARHSRFVKADQTVDFDALDAHRVSLEAKILHGFDNFERNTGKTHPFALKDVVKRGYGDALTNYNNVLWYGNIAVGTPPLPLNVVFDTGSSDLFLSATTCDATCSGHTLWNPDASSTAQDLGYQFELKYGGGAVVWGEEYTDTVTIGSLSATSQTLGAVSSYSSTFELSKFPADGVMGMAFQSISDFDASPVFQTLIFEGQADAVFSFKVSSSGAELYLGGSNSALYTGDFSYVPITEQGFWQVTMDNIQGNGQMILSNVDAIVDTGSTFIVGPPSDVSTLYNAVGGTYVPQSLGYYTFPCDSFPSISFSFSGTVFPISASALNLGPLSFGSSDCVSAIVGQNTGYTFWVVGDAFLQGVYTTFDVGNSRVGFAQLA